MPFIPVLHYTLIFSENGSTFNLFTPERIIERVHFSKEATAAVIAILNGRSPEYVFDNGQHVLRGKGGMSREAADNIIARANNGM